MPHNSWQMITLHPACPYPFSFMQTNAYVSRLGMSWHIRVCVCPSACSRGSVTASLHLLPLPRNTCKRGDFNLISQQSVTVLTCSSSDDGETGGFANKMGQAGRGTERILTPLLSVTSVVLIKSTARSHPPGDIACEGWGTLYFWNCGRNVTGGDKGASYRLFIKVQLPTNQQTLMWLINLALLYSCYIEHLTPMLPGLHMAAVRWPPSQ